MPDPWQTLEQELEAWSASGRRATLWWRDDDAVAPTPALDRLLGLALRSGLPIALAVIPARLSRRLPDRLSRAAGLVTVLQHGYAHRNHAPAGEKKQELGGHRPAASVLEEMSRGAAMMDAAFGPCRRAGAEPARAPVLVPPWNRIDAGYLPALPGLGFRGVSCHGPRPAAQPTAGLAQTNSHVDIMRWQAPRGFVGQAEALGQLTEQLRRRRMGEVDAEEPTGLLSHHLAHDDAAWTFLERLTADLAARSEVAFLAAAEAFRWPAPDAATPAVTAK